MSRRLSLLTLLILVVLALPSAAQMPAVAPAKAQSAAKSQDAATLAPQSATTIFLVRHAEKAAPTGDVELSEAGQKRAASLATTLSDANLQAIYTTEYKRTKATAAPTAAKAGVTAEVIAGADMGKLIATLQKERRGNVLVVGHSNTVPKIIEGLGGATVTIKDEEYDHLYVVTLAGGQFVSLAALRYCN